MLSTYENPLTPAQRQALRSAAEAAFPQEACGFILADGSVVECQNRSTVPEQFVISAADYAQHDPAGIEVVWHTHANYQGFSPADITACKALGLPYAVWDCASSQSYWLDPQQSAGLVNRPWAYGIHDCYSAVRDWWFQQHGLEMGDYPRTQEGEWHSADFTHFEDSFQKEGFRQVGLDDLQRGDVIMFRIRNLHTSNHVAIVEDPSQNLLYQHLVGRLSGLTAYSHWLRENSYMAVRHESRW